MAAEAFHEATLRARAAAAVGSHHHHSSHQHHQHEGAGAAAAADPPAAAAPAPSPLKSLERAHALGKAFGMNADGFEAAVLWPQIVGVYQLPLDQVWGGAGGRVVLCVVLLNGWRESGGGELS